MTKFSPFVQIVRTGERIAVMFDSQCADDATRIPRIVYVPCEMDGLSWSVFLSDSGTSCVDLVVSNGDAETHHRLGEITAKVEHAAVQQGLANAFQGALAAFLQTGRQIAATGSDVASLDPPRDAYGPSHPSPGTPAAQQLPAGRTFLKSVSAVAAIGVLGFLGIYSFSVISGHEADPIKAAVAQNMAQDPASITAQVELTKETLRQMGLDPGRGGDLGCLAPQ